MITQMNLYQDCVSTENVYLESKPEVRSFVRFRGGGVFYETNFVRFAGLLRTFAMVPN